MKNAIATKNAPGAIGPYSQAIATDTMIYTSGQLGLTPDERIVVGQMVVDAKDIVVPASRSGREERVITRYRVGHLIEFLLVHDFIMGG